MAGSFSFDSAMCSDGPEYYFNDGKHSEPIFDGYIEKAPLAHSEPGVLGILIYLFKDDAEPNQLPPLKFTMVSNDGKGEGWTSTMGVNFTSGQARKVALALLAAADAVDSGWPAKVE